MKRLILTMMFFIGLTIPLTKAQEIKWDKLSHYSPSVIARIFEVTQKVPLADNQLTRIARLYQLEDSAIAVSVSTGTQLLQLSANMLKLADLRDSLINNYQIQRYFKKRIVVLDSIKAIDSKKQQNMLHWFANICRQKTEESFADHFNTTMQRFLSDTTYYGCLYRNEITRRAQNNGYQQTAKYARDHKLSQECFKELSVLLYEKEKQLLVVDRTFPYFNKVKGQYQKAIDTRNDSLINSLLIREGANSNTSQIAEALRYKKTLSITTTQVDSLVFYEESADSSSRKDTDFIVAKFEKEKLIQLLNEEQLNEFLMIRNRKTVVEVSKRYWNEIKIYKVAQVKDSVKYYPQIVNYNLACWVANDRYQYDDRIRPKIIKEINKTKPSILNDLEVTRKMADKVIQDSLQTKKYQGNFKW